MLFEKLHHYHRNQLGISPKSGRVNVESSSHGFFDKLKTSRLHDFMCEFLFGDDPEVNKENGSIHFIESKEIVDAPRSIDKNLDNKKLCLLARQLFLTPEIIRRETLVYLHEIDSRLHMDEISFAATPKAIHSYCQ